MIKLRFCFMFWVMLGTAFAQTPEQMYERDYKRAINNFNKGDYITALTDLTPLTSARFNLPQTPFAHYYHALVSFKTNRLAESRQMLTQLQDRFPYWAKLDEARYLMATVLFSEKKYGEAMINLDKITTLSLNTDVAVLRKNIATALLQQNTPPSTPISAPTKTHVPNWQKGYYGVAVLMPFKIDNTTNPTQARTNQYAYEMYEGMKQGVQKLQKEGIKMDLKTFDINNIKEEAQAVVQDAAFAQADIVIGPVHPEAIKVVKEYTEANEVFMVNPMSISNDQALKQNYMLLLQASLDRQSQVAFDFGKAISQPNNRKIAIYYGSTRRDTLMAFSYMTKAMAARYQVIDYRKTREKLDSTASISPTNKPTHVVVFSSNSSDGQKVLSMMSKRKVVAPVLSSTSAFDFYNLSSASLDNRTIYFIDNDFVDYSKPLVRDFQTAYFARTNTLPSIYAMQGYDMVLYYGRMLHKHKEKLREGLNKETTPQPDLLLNGFDYRQSNENKIVPILRLEGTRLVLVD